ncbi:MAG: hypothetical protein JXX29_04535 [Deltaproteobacteria bacterium]|nr:hypothetical protein [Deltaproteobacteria bacterium]MBN2670912.1 hypothetical protein [Deltaproteobacteria bacterium]
MIKYFYIFVPVLLYGALGTALTACGEDEQSSEESDSEEAVDIQQNCSYGCVSPDACNAIGGTVDMTFTCPNTANICCDRYTNYDNDSEDNNNNYNTEPCRYTCVDFSACEMSAMHTDMTCSAGVCCDSPNETAMDTGEPCSYNCVPYAACEYFQMHPEMNCGTVGQLCCDTTYVWVDTETDGTDSDDTDSPDTDTVDSDTADSETDGTDTEDTDSLDTDTDTDTDTGTPVCDFWCVAASDCPVSAYRPDMTCDGDSIVCCDL